jgi:TolB protein
MTNLAVLSVAMFAGACAQRPGATTSSIQPEQPAQGGAGAGAQAGANASGYPGYAVAGGAAIANGANAPEGDGLKNDVTNPPGARPGAASEFAGAGDLMDGLESLSQVTFAGEGATFDPAVSRDGSFVVFAGTQHRPTADLYLKPTGGNTVTQLTADPAQDVMPAISPDGKRIAFASDRAGSWDLFVMSSAGGRAVQLTTQPTAELSPSWSPDGKKLCFARLGEVSGRWEIWVLDVDNPAAAEFVGFGQSPRWCPVAATGENGSDKIAFQRGRERGDRAFSLWTIDYAPGKVSSPTEIVPASGGAAINPAWSSDGGFLIYSFVPSVAAESGEGLAAADLWMTSLSGGNRVNLTGGRFSNLMPTWSGDGRVYFASDRGGTRNVWSIGTARALAAVGGNPNAMRALTAAPATSPTAAPDEPKDGADRTSTTTASEDPSEP